MSNLQGSPWQTLRSPGLKSNTFLCRTCGNASNCPAAWEDTPEALVRCPICGMIMNLAQVWKWPLSDRQASMISERLAATQASLRLRKPFPVEDVELSLAREDEALGYVQGAVEGHERLDQGSSGSESLAVHSIPRPPAAAAAGPFAGLHNLIIDMFRSHDVLNGICLPDDVLKCDGIVVATEETPNIDWRKVDALYQIFTPPVRAAESDPTVCHTQGQLEMAQGELRKTLQTHLQKFFLQPKTPFVHVGELRFFLILLANPLDRPSRTTESWSSNAHAIHKRLLGLLTNLPSSCKDVMTRWFSALPDERFRDFIAFGHRYLSTCLRNEKFSKDGPRRRKTKWWSVSAGTNYMLMLYRANERRDPETRIPPTEFWNQALDSFLLSDPRSMRTELEAWHLGDDSFSFFHYPSLLSMAVKQAALKVSAEDSMERAGPGTFWDDREFVIEVGRNHVLEDSYRAVVFEEASLFRKALKVRFKDEKGVDYGALKKNFFELVFRELYRESIGIFVVDEESNMAYLKGGSHIDSSYLYFAGTMLGLAYYNSVMVDHRFPICFFRKLLEFQLEPTTEEPLDINTSLRELDEFNPAVARSLEAILSADDISSMHLTFTVSDPDTGTPIDLCPNGTFTPVTTATKTDYVRLVLDHYLNRSIAAAFTHLATAFWRICAPLHPLTLLPPSSLSRLLSGSREPLDIPTLRARAIHLNYPPPPPPHLPTTDPDPSPSPTLTWFWQTFAAAPPDRQRDILRFITASDRVPPTGVANLVLRIQRVDDDGEAEAEAQAQALGKPGRRRRPRLPEAQTCFNTLRLPEYATRDVFEERFWFAVEGCDGSFGRA